MPGIERAPHATLKPTLGLPVLVLYGLGTTVGAGIYALLGAVAGTAGMRAPFAFLAASILASFTALAFCELSARMPRAGGEATYVDEAFGSAALTLAVGGLMAFAGCVSAATVTHGFTGYAAGMAGLPDWLWMVGLVATLGAIAIWGIGESALVAGLVTLVEVGGLLLVISVQADAFADLPAHLPEMWPSADSAAWGAIGAASLICFYAYLGFEDMVNLAEEVHGAQRVMPIAILTTLGLTMALYVVLSSLAVVVVPPAELASSEAPLALLYSSGSNRAPGLLHLIGMLAMLNGALVQIIKASRLLYGLADQGRLPRWLAYVHPRTRTPVVTTTLAIATTLVFCFALPIAPLAELTSAVTLVVFGLTNAALVVTKRRGPAPAGVFTVPLAIPVLGAVVSLGFLALEGARRLA